MADGEAILIASGGRGRGGEPSKNRADARKLRISVETSYEYARFPGANYSQKRRVRPGDPLRRHDRYVFPAP